MLSGGQPLREASDGHGGPPQGRGAGGALPSPWTRRWLGAEGLLDRPDSPLIAAAPCETDIDWCRRLEMLLAHAPGFVARIDCRTAREREDGADRLAARVLIVHRASSAAEPTLVHPSSNPAFDRMALAQAELIARQAQRLVQKGGAQRSVWTFEDDSPRAARLTLEAVMGELIP